MYISWKLTLVSCSSYHFYLHDVHTCMMSSVETWKAEKYIWLSFLYPLRILIIEVTGHYSHIRIVFTWCVISSKIEPSESLNSSYPTNSAFPDFLSTLHSTTTKILFGDKALLLLEAFSLYCCVIITNCYRSLYTTELNPPLLVPDVYSLWNTSWHLFSLHSLPGNANINNVSVMACCED